MPNIYQKLQAIQQELKAPKGQFNKFGGYAYRSAEDILEAVKPLLAKHGCALKLSDEMVEVGGRVYVQATATLISAGDMTAEAKITNQGMTLSIDTTSVTAYAREDAEKKGMDGSQITGAASSYARKYALNGMFCIDDTKDADATNDHGKTYRNGKTKAQAREKAATQDPMQKAKARMSRAIDAWAKRTGSDAKKAKQSLTSRPDYQPTPEFCIKVAEEFEAIVASYAAKDGQNGQE